MKTCMYISALALVLLTLAVMPARSEAAYPSGVSYHARWTDCRVHLDWATMTHVTYRHCTNYTMVRETRHPIGHTITSKRLSPHVIERVHWPVFYHPAPTQPTGRVMWFAVTGYSWGCGTPNGVTASGTVPGVGTVASNYLPIGAHVYVPSLGYSGVVLDRGAPLDLFAASCAATYAYTGYREVIVS